MPATILELWANSGFPMPDSTFHYAISGETIPYEDLDLDQAGESFDTRHELTRWESRNSPPTIGQLLPELRKSEDVKRKRPARGLSHGRHEQSPPGPAHNHRMGQLTPGGERLRFGREALDDWVGSPKREVDFRTARVELLFCPTDPVAVVLAALRAQPMFSPGTGARNSGDGSNHETQSTGHEDK